MRDRTATQAAAPVKSIVVGTAGHIDHGKTALVQALTGTDTDRLPEEKARGITIDLGFAALELDVPGGTRLEISLVDVPGHHAFIRNMLAGAGGIEAVMLIVAADEGPKAQTVEHLQICQLLGVQRGLVVLTKRDAVTPERLREAEAEVQSLTRGSFLEAARVLAVSALQKQGIEELSAALARLASEIPAHSQDYLPRLPVDRVFSVRGFGTVVTGTLRDGALRSGEAVQVLPDIRSHRIRGLQVHGRGRAQAEAPHRVALNLAGVEVAEIRRGATAVRAGSLETAQVVDVELDPLPEAPRLRHRQRVRVHAFTAESVATLLLLEEADPVSGRKAIARLKLGRPMLVLPGDRFVLRQPSPAVTVAGGRVLDAHPLPRRATKSAWLRQMQAASGETSLLLRIQRRGADGIALERLSHETGFTPEAVGRMLRRPTAEGAVVRLSPDAFGSGAALKETEAQLLRELRAALDGAARGELRSRLHLPEATFGAAMQRLQSSRQVRAEGDRLALWQEGRPANAFAQSTGQSEAIDRLYREAGLASPLANEAGEQLGIAAPEMRALLTGLLRAGNLVRLGSDALLVHREALEALRSTLAKHKGQSLDVGRFKTLTGLTRKHAIPLLEYLDGARLTRNAGGVRTIL